jgi:hypothetical protein
MRVSLIKRKEMGILRNTFIAFLVVTAAKMAAAGIYFPLHVGDTWTYNQTGICDNFFICKAVGDTFFDGKQYFKGSFIWRYELTEFARSDSNGVYGYDTTAHREYTVFDFRAKAGDTVSVVKNSITTCINSTTFKRTSNNSSSGTIYYLKDSVGVYSTSQISIPCGDQLSYAIIGGRRWPTSVGGHETIVPGTYFLSENYPNPFNPSTTLRYGIPERSRVRIAIHNSIGQLVSSAIDEMKNSGFYEFTFDGAQLSSGIYFYRLEAISERDPDKVFIETKKMILEK